MVAALLILLSMASLPQPFVAPRASAAVEEIFDQFLGPSSNEYDNTYVNQKLAQSFVASSTYRITRIELNILDRGLDNFVTLTLTSNNNVDNTPFLPLVSSVANGPDGWDWVSFSLTWSVAAGDVFWIELLDNANQQSNGYSWAKRSSSNYTSGNSATCSGSNCRWQINPTDDYLFKVYGISGPSIDAWCEVNSPFAGSGDPLNYTVHFDNTGTQYAPSLWINMTLAPNQDLLYESDDSATYGGTSSSPKWLFKNVVVGPHSFHVNVTVGSNVDDGTVLRANFTFQYSDSKGRMEEDRSCSVITIARVPSLTLYKGVSPTYSIQGSLLNYTMTFSNSGSRPAAAVWINDTLPSGVDYVNDTAKDGTGPGNTSWIFTGRNIAGSTISWSFANVVPGTYRFDFNVTIDVAVLNGTPIVNCAELNYTDSNMRMVGPVIACATARVAGASIRVKSETLDSPVARNDTLRYLVTFDNEGTAPAATVWVNDTLPAGVTYVQDNALNTPGYNTTYSWRDSRHLYYVFKDVQTNDPLLQPRNFYVTVKVGTAVNDGDMLCNHADLEYTDWDGTRLMPSSSESCSQVRMPQVDLDAKSPATADPGDLVTYFINITNLGDGVADEITLGVRESQQLVPYYENSSNYGAIRKGPQVWAFNDVGQGLIALGFTYRLKTGVTDGMQLVSYVDLNYTDYKGRWIGSDWASLTTTVTKPIMTLAMIQNYTEIGRGDQITYTIFYNNTGTGIARNVWMNVTIPDDTVLWGSSEQYAASSGRKFTWHFLDVPPGEHQMTVTLSVDARAEVGSQIDNYIDMIYEDANGNYIDRLMTDISAEVVNGETTDDKPPVQADYLWPIVLVLLATLAVMWLFVGRKFYGLGVKDKARIDELFLLHRSGELIRHHSRSLRADVDSDVLSAMLVAVQNFVKESFNFRAGDLEELKFGNQKIMLIHGEHVILAAVIAGPFPQRLVPGMRSALEEVETRFGSSLDDWSGMTEDLPKIDDILSKVFDSRAVQN